MLDDEIELIVRLTTFVPPRHVLVGGCPGRLRGYELIGSCGGRVRAVRAL